ncbi:hypothetical protein OAA62_00040 [bacterium]|nr:hypothetical protein [bacterium]
MARVEITKSRGPEAIESWNGPSSTTPGENYGPIVNVGNYTLHSYQVINEGSGITFNILGSNYTKPNGEPSQDFDKHWTVISSHSVAVGSSSNPTSIAYSDTWNFKFSSILIQGSSTQVKVLEKHNP